MQETIQNNKNSIIPTSQLQEILHCLLLGFDRSQRISPTQEVFDEKQIYEALTDIILRMTFVLILEDRNFWSHHYSKIYDDCYHDVKEKIHATTIRNHCKANNVPLILMTINNCQTKLKFDLDLDLDKYPREKGGHPNAEGHIMIANDILTSYENIL